MTRKFVSIGCCVAILALGRAASVTAQSQTPLTRYTVATWTDKDGLPSGRVRALAQDKDGYLWLGTDSGVIRFDGVRFASWEALGLPQVPHGIVSTLLSARDGSLWVGFEFGGVLRLRDGKLQIWSAPNEIGVSYTAALMEDHAGAIWVVSREGLHRFADGHWDNLVGRDGLPTGKEVMAVYEDSRQDLWVALRDSIFKRPRGQARFEQIDTLEEATLLYQSFSEDASGVVWRTDLRRGARPIGDHRQEHNPIGGLGVQVLHDRRGNLWIGTRGEGLWHVPAGHTDRFDGIERLTLSDGLPSDSVNALVEDRDGNIWVGLSSGLQRYSRRRVNIITEYGPGGMLAAMPDGSIWVGTARGLVRFSNNQTRIYGEQDGLPGPRVISLNVAGNDLWVVTARGLAKFEHGRFSPVVSPELDRLVRLAAMATQSDTTWFHDAQQGLFRESGGVLQQPGGLPDAFNRRVFDMRVDTGGTYWVAGVDGILAAVNPNGDVRTLTLPIGDVATLYDDHDGALWVGGRYGLSRVVGEKVTTINHQNGLPDNITAVVEDNDGVLWVGCGNGIVRLEKAEFDKGAADRNYQVRFKVLDTSDGTAGSPLSGRSKSARAADGRLWFATSAGITIVDPHDPDVMVAWQPPRPIVETLAANGRPVTLGPGLQLPSRTSHLRFDYTALDLTHPLRMRFRYRLEGVDHDWTNAGSSSRALYANMSAGTYRFLLMASDGSGDWVGAAAPFEFTIAPTFYQTRTFYAVAVGAIALTAWGAWQLRIRQMRSQLAQVLAERVRMSRAIHDTLLQGLAALALHIDHLAETTTDQRRDTFVALRRRIESYVREARRSIWELRSPTLLDHDFVTALKNTSERIFSDTPVAIEFVVNGTPLPCPSKVEEHLLSIAHEAMSNAFRHAQAQRVRLGLDYHDHNVRITVRDNGRGFDLVGARTLDKHYGLVTMQEHADQVRGALKITTSPGQGTEVEVVVPISEAA